MIKSENYRFEIFDEEDPRLTWLSYTYALNMAQATSQLIGDGLKSKDQVPKLKAGGKPSTWLPPGRLVELFST